MTTVPIYRPHAAGATGGNYSHGSPAASCRSHIAITQSPSRRLRHRKRPSEITYSTRARILHAHHANVRAFINKYGEKVGALTLTFDHDVPNAERERRYNSLAVNVLRPKYGAAIVVAEFHQSGLLHYHALLGVKKQDLHHRVDWKAQARYWKAIAPRYGCGRVEFTPVRNGAAYGRYLLKDLAQPTPNAVRVRRIRYIGAMRREWVDKATGEIKKGKLPEFCRPYS